jgi:hypothetical protein
MAPPNPPPKGARPGAIDKALDRRYQRRIKRQLGLHEDSADGWLKPTKKRRFSLRECGGVETITYRAQKSGADGPRAPLSETGTSV